MDIVQRLQCNTMAESMYMIGPSSLIAVQGAPEEVPDLADGRARVGVRHELAHAIRLVDHLKQDLGVDSQQERCKLP